MRWFNWRRASAVVAIVVGFAVGSSTTPASANPHNNGNGNGGGSTTAQDYWW